MSYRIHIRQYLLAVLLLLVNVWPSPGRTPDHDPHDVDSIWLAAAQCICPAVDEQQDTFEDAMRIGTAHMNVVSGLQSAPSGGSGGMAIYCPAPDATWPLLGVGNNTDLLRWSLLSRCIHSSLLTSLYPKHAFW